MPTTMYRLRPILEGIIAAGRQQFQQPYKQISIPPGGHQSIIIHYQYPYGVNYSTYIFNFLNLVVMPHFLLYLLSL